MRWVHIGDDETYIALNQARADAESRGKPYGGRPGLNHLAYEVDDVEALRSRLRAAGYQDSTVPNAHPYRKRVYFYDPDGNDWEFVQYLSNAPAERHDYELPDL
jgi:catechol 2,3-dioxygenase-like lactoylglutathione lyase family enzyme